MNRFYPPNPGSEPEPEDNDDSRFDLSWDANEDSGKGRIANFFNRILPSPDTMPTIVLNKKVSRPRMVPTTLVLVGALGMYASEGGETVEEMGRNTTKGASAFIRSIADGAEAGYDWYLDSAKDCFVDPFCTYPEIIERYSGSPLGTIGIHAVELTEFDPSPYYLPE